MAKSMKSFLHPTEGHYKEMMTDRQYDGLRIIENEFGLKGYAVFWKLVEKICGSSEGYCIEWNDRVGELFAADLRVNCSLVLDIVNRLISVGVFDESLFAEYGILTASFIQDNWAAVKKRSYEIKEAYRLVKCTPNSESVCKTGQNVSKKGQNVCKTPPNLTKLNLTELNLTERHSETQDFSVVDLTDEERKELVSLSDSLSVERYIKNLAEWQLRNHKKSKRAFIIIKRYIEEEKSKQKAVREDKDTSYDLDIWEQRAGSMLPLKGEKP
ncbi:MAG: DUF4373 domain-containing protein [Ruminococcus sp.]|nr:DUF4373 domain-containing protein [Ruminococcus sp.]